MAPLRSRVPAAMAAAAALALLLPAAAPVPFAAMAARAATGATPGADGADGAGDEVLLDELAIAGDGHVAWRVSGPAGARVRMHSTVDPGDAGMAGRGVWIVPPSGAVWGGMGMGFSLVEVRAGLQAADPRLDLDLRGPGAVGFTTSGSVPVLLDGAGDWIVVFAAAADGEVASEARLYGDPGVTLMGRSTGPAFLHRETDFHGTVSAVYKGVGHQAKVLLDTHLDLDVRHRLFGAFSGDNACGVLRVAHQGPAGAGARDVPAGGWFHAPFRGAPPGAYELRIAENRDLWPCPTPGDAPWPPEVWFAGADVALP